MPIYEYRCAKCGEFEEMQRITDPPLTRCPTCRGKVTRLISSTSFQLKGSGWYVTDYARARKEEKAPHAEKSDSSAASEASEKPAEAKKEKSSETKKEKKTRD